MHITPDANPSSDDRERMEQQYLQSTRRLDNQVQPWRYLGVGVGVTTVGRLSCASRFANVVERISSRRAREGNGLTSIARLIRMTRAHIQAVVFYKLELRGVARSTFIICKIVAMFMEQLTVEWQAPTEHLS